MQGMSRVPVLAITQTRLSRTSAEKGDASTMQSSTDLPNIMPPLTEFKSDDIVSCPYVFSHQLQLSKKETHLTKCRKNFPLDVDMKLDCPFNSDHRVPHKEMDLHCRLCPDRTQEKYDRKNESVSRIPVENRVISTEEDWEMELAPIQKSAASSVVASSSRVTAIDKKTQAQPQRAGQYNERSTSANSAVRGGNSSNNARTSDYMNLKRDEQTSSPQSNVLRKNFSARYNGHNNDYQNGYLPGNAPKSMISPKNGREQYRNKHTYTNDDDYLHDYLPGRAPQSFTSYKSTREQHMDSDAAKKDNVTCSFMEYQQKRANKYENNNEEHYFSQSDQRTEVSPRYKHMSSQDYMPEEETICFTKPMKHAYTRGTLEESPRCNKYLDDNVEDSVATPYIYSSNEYIKPKHVNCTISQFRDLTLGSQYPDQKYSCDPPESCSDRNKQQPKISPSVWRSESVRKQMYEDMKPTPGFHAIAPAPCTMGGPIIRPSAFVRMQSNVYDTHAGNSDVYVPPHRRQEYHMITGYDDQYGRATSCSMSQTYKPPVGVRESQHGQEQMRGLNAATSFKYSGGRGIRRHIC